MAKSRALYPFLASFLSVALISSLLLPTQSAEAQQAPGGESRGRREVIERRTATSRTFSNPDGSFTSHTFVTPIHYRDANGAWKEISDRLVPSRAPGYAWRNEANGFRTLFKDKLEGDFLRLDVNGQPFSFSLKGASSSAPGSIGGGDKPEDPPSDLSPEASPSASPSPDPSAPASPTPDAQPSATDPSPSDGGSAPEPSPDATPTEGSEVPAALPTQGPPEAIPSAEATTTPGSSAEPPPPTAGKTPEPKPTSPASQSDSRIVYDEVFPGVDFRYDVLPDALKETIVIAGPDAPTRYSFVLDAPKGLVMRAEEQPDGSWAFFEAAQPSPMFALAAPFAVDASDSIPDRDRHASMDATQEGSRFEIQVDLDAEWLRSPERQFPVELDPTIYVYGAVEDASFDALDPTRLALAGDRVYVGTAPCCTWRGAAKFDIDAIPVGAKVSNAELKMYFDGMCIAPALIPNCGSTSHQLDAHLMTSSWSLSSTSADIGFDPTVVASDTLLESPVRHWMSWNLTNQVNNWLTGASPNHGLLLKRATEESGKSGPMLIGSRYANADLRPYVEATYWSNGVFLNPPETIHSNGADLTWSAYDGYLYGGPAFDRYEIHRSTTPHFVPSASTLLTTIRDVGATSYRDTTAAPNARFSYEVVMNTEGSNEQIVTTPGDGRATAILQPGANTGKATYISHADGSSNDCSNDGLHWEFIVGRTATSRSRGLIAFDLRNVPTGSTVESARLSLYRRTWSNADNTNHKIDVHRVTTDWAEGTGGGCSGSGASWAEADGGRRWNTAGADYDPNPAGSDTLSDSEPKTGWDEFDVTGLAQKWVNAEAPNHGFLVKEDVDSGGSSSTIWYSSDDAYLRENPPPKLVLSYVDGSHARGPDVAISSLSDGAKVTKTVEVRASALDDRRVETVDFLVDGVVKGTDTASPYSFAWDTTSANNGSHTVAARATDDAGNVTTSASVNVGVGNSAPPSVGITSPSGGNATASGTTTVTADAADDVAVTKVEFYFNGIRIGDPDTTSPYSVSWNTLDVAQPAYDGSHSLTAKAYDEHDQVTTSAAQPVTVDNTNKTKYKAGFTSSAVPPLMRFDPDALAQEKYPVDVTVTNNSTGTWTGSDLELRYRWLNPDTNAVVAEGAATAFGTNLGKGASRTFSKVQVEAPTLPSGVDKAQYKLRFDLFEKSTGAYFAAKGNKPLENPVIVNKALKTALGIERYHHYDGEEVGAGMGHLVNVANGNSLLSWSPFMSPGRGLSTVVDLTYNSLEDRSESPVGNNFSLGISSLTRFGLPIDIHPNNADTLAGRSSTYIDFTDSDGTTHRFTKNAAGGWDEPPGVHLYLREYGTGEKKWAFTRPDRVTFFYDEQGYPTSVEDKNGNRIRFTLADVAPGEDPGGVSKRITAVTDAAGLDATPAPNRTFSIDYYSKDEAKKPQVRGKIKSIRDHNGSALLFDYYEDGNLLRLTQQGGTKADGTMLADRNFVFTYTTSSGSGPAIPVAADRENPQPRTSNQSTRIYSVRDPRGRETLFSYVQTTGADRWKLLSRTDRAGAATNFAYDTTTRTTTVTAPESRVTKYGYDTSGQVTSIVNPKSETTTLTWSADRHVTKVTEPTGKYTEFAYNANGYVTDQWDQLRNHITLAYENLPVDAGDTVTRWKLGRTIPHISQLKTKTDARGSTWNLGYDAKGNLTSVTEPEGSPAFTSTYAFNPDGTLASATDQNGKTTTFPAYDPNGLVTKISDAKSQVTTLSYDDDGLLRWVQDPVHQSYSGGDPREYRTYFDYDSFHRLGRQSTPKSSEFERGKLIWSGADYDGNDNLIAETAPSHTPGGGARSTYEYDPMDRMLSATNPESEKSEFIWDLAGRLSKATSPKGSATPAIDKDFATFYDYDPLDRVVKETAYETDPAGAVTRTRWTHLCYDLAGDLVRSTAPRAALASVDCGAAPAPHTSRYEYDAAHKPTAVIDPLGHRRSATYDPNGNVDTETDEDTTTRTLVYDKRNLLVKVIEPFERGTTPRELTTKYVYDAAGNLKTEISPRAWDASPDKTTFNDYVTAYDYDAVNQMVKVTLPKAGTEAATYVHNDYDANGNLQWSTLPTSSADPTLVPAGQKTINTYFDPGWVRSSDDPSPTPKVNYDYTAEGWQSHRWPEGRQTTELMQWSYFPDGMLEEEKDKGGQPRRYAYDRNNNVTSITDASGLVSDGDKGSAITIDYNGFDETSKVKDRKEGDDAGNFSVSTYSYDLNGNVTTRVDNREETPAGALVKEGRKQEFTYDEADWLKTQLDLGTDSACTDDQRITNSFTSQGWESQRIVEHRAATCGGETSAVWQTRQTTDWTYFLNGKLKTLTTKGATGEVVESHDVSYLSEGIYVNGHRTRDTFIRKSPDSGAPCTATQCVARYSYDARERLTQEDNGHGTATTYKLDAAGNILEETQSGTTSATKSYTYDGNRLATLTASGLTSKYFYDEWGNTDCVTLQAGSQADCKLASGQPQSVNLVVDYGYDYLNRLSSYRSFATDGVTSIKDDETTYTYDALDRMASQKESHGTGVQRATTFTYQGLTDLVTKEEHRDPAGALSTTKSYSYDAYGNRISMTDAQAGQSPETFTYGYDVHGNVSLLLDKAGQAKASYGYTAYGAADKALTKGDEDQDNPLNPYRYSGFRLDSGSGTLDMGARRFGPETSRFLQQDQLSGVLEDLDLSLDPLTQNRYSLAGGNPVSFVEWDGHVPVDGGGGGGAKKPNPKPTRRGGRGGGGSSSPADFRRAETSRAVAGSGSSSINIGKSTMRRDDLRTLRAAGIQTQCTDNCADLGATLAGGCRLLGPCAIKEAIQSGNWSRAAAETAMALPWGKLLKGAKFAGKLFNRADDARDATRAIGFASGEGISALPLTRLQHASRHLSEAGVLPAWRGATSPGVVRRALTPILERPTASFDDVLRGTRVKGFLGEINGQQVAALIYKEGMFQGQIATSFIPSAKQLAGWGF